MKSFVKLEDGSHTSQIEIKLDNNDNIISYGCPNCKNMHIVTESEKIQKYQFQMNPKMTSNYEFDFALYASSGYRMIDYQDNSSTYYSNPLAQTLEFEKKNPQATSIEDWIRQALQNKYAAIGMATQNGNSNIQKEIHSQVVDRITDSIRKVVGADFDFILQLQPTKVKFKYGNSKNELEFNLLADGLKSLISWMIDLARMLDSLHWKDKKRSILDQNIIIFLDEIEVHLHPLWQRKVLPMVTTLFPNAQIFVSTHSPFIINSVDGAWVYKLQVNENGNSKVVSKHQSNTAISYLSEYISTFGIEDEFGESTQKDLDEFEELIEQPEIDKIKLKAIIQQLLAKKSIAIDNTVGIALRKLKRLKNIDIEL